MRRFDIEKLKEIDKARKADDTQVEDVHREWAELHAYYEDRSRSLTRQFLEDLGMGISSNEFPIEFPMLRKLVRRRATVYKEPASRWLTKENKILKEGSLQSKLYREIIEQQVLNLRLRNADRLRTLFSQIVIAVGASDFSRSTVIHSVAPYNVFRDPGDDPESIGADKRFAILTSGPVVSKLGTDQRFQFWQRDDEDRWLVAEVDGVGNLISYPFEATGRDPELSPYGATVPFHIMYAEDPDGAAWINPPLSRLSMQKSTNAKGNDLMALVRSEAHEDEVFATPDADDVPEQTGPGTRFTVPQGTTRLSSSKNPKIDGSISSMRNAQKFQFIAEGLPHADLDESKTILTGAALRVERHELQEIREEQIELVPRDERAIFEGTRAVHNVHAGTWRRERLDPELGLRVRVGGMETPTEMEKEQGWAHKEIDRKYLHPVEWVMRRDQVDEEKAIEIWEHTADLFERIPVEDPPAPAPEVPAPVGSPGGDRLPPDSGEKKPTDPEPQPPALQNSNGKA